MTPDEFVAQILPFAKSSQIKTRIPTAFTIAEAALESNWGKSLLATNGFNLFGVKADKSWAGRTVIMPTREFLNSEWRTVDAAWRRYASWGDSIDDHAKFLTDNKRYAAAFDHCADPREFAKAIAAAGYATDPKYADKIISVINAHCAGV